eukprot:GHVT01028086.1.p1 GENE.GHVT01028086.1~~GHVT01028086.1.p1  ORF type:complete len:805 (+),score=216.16 GHVT01028086.1:882-3296(+)
MLIFSSEGPSRRVGLIAGLALAVAACCGDQCVQSASAAASRTSGFELIQRSSFRGTPTSFDGASLPESPEDESLSASPKASASFPKRISLPGESDEAAPEPTIASSVAPDTFAAAAAVASDSPHISRVALPDFTGASSSPYGGAAAAPFSSSSFEATKSSVADGSSDGFSFPYGAAAATSSSLDLSATSPPSAPSSSDYDLGSSDAGGAYGSSYPAYKPPVDPSAKREALEALRRARAGIEVASKASQAMGTLKNEIDRFVSRFAGFEFKFAKVRGPSDAKSPINTTQVVQAAMVYEDLSNAGNSLYSRLTESDVSLSEAVAVVDAALEEADAAITTGGAAGENSLKADYAVVAKKFELIKSTKIQYKIHEAYNKVRENMQKFVADIKELIGQKREDLQSAMEAVGKLAEIYESNTENAETFAHTLSSNIKRINDQAQEMLQEDSVDIEAFADAVRDAVDTLESQSSDEESSLQQFEKKHQEQYQYIANTLRTLRSVNNIPEKYFPKGAIPAYREEMIALSEQVRELRAMQKFDRLGSQASKAFASVARAREVIKLKASSLTKLKDIQKKITSFVEESTEPQETIDKLDSSTEEINKDAQEIAEQLALLSTELQELTNGKIQPLQQKLQKLEADTSQLETLMKSLEVDADLATPIMTTQNGRIANCKSDLATLQDELKELKQRTADKTAQETEYKKKLTAIGKEREAEKEKLATLRQNIENMKKERSAILKDGPPKKQKSASKPFGQMSPPAQGRPFQQRPQQSYGGMHQQQHQQQQQQHYQQHQQRRGEYSQPRPERTPFGRL